MNETQIFSAIRDIGLALNISHNCIASDVPGAKIDKDSWIIDHEKEIVQLKKLEELLLNKNNCL